MTAGPVGARRVAAWPVRGGASWLIAAVFVAIVVSYCDFVPYWDAKSYFNCIAIAAGKPFDLLNFRCVGHPSIVYLFLVGFTHYLAPWNVFWTNATNALLGAASIVAFHELLRVLFPKTSGEHILVTALYAFAPLFVVHAIFLNVDYGLTAFFVLCLYFLVARRFWIASIFGVAMMFSKETGAAAYVVTVAAYVVAFTLRTSLSWRERAAALRQQAPLAAAPIVLGLYLAGVHGLRSNPGSWLASYAAIDLVPDHVDSILNTNLADIRMRSYLADIFVLNFQWLYTAGLVAASCAAAVRPPTDRHEAQPAMPGSGLFLSLALAGLVYVVTRYRGFNNARYVLIVSPMLILASYRALLSVLANGAARRLVLAVIAVLVFLSNFRTIDPGSKLVFGTFKFGSHALLDMPSLIGGLRMDSIVYNLESLQFHYLMNDMLQDLRPAPHTVFFMGDTTYNFPAIVDARSYRLTLDASHALPLSILSNDGDEQRDRLRAHVARDGDPIFYMAFANADNHQLRNLLRLYPLIGTRQYARSGYTLDVYTFRFTATP